jgi:hypothetical protein
VLALTVLREKVGCRSWQMVGKGFADKPKVNLRHNISFNPHPSPPPQAREGTNCSMDKPMIYAELKSIISPDIIDLKSYFPEDPESFSFMLQLLIGPKNQDGAESFQVEVCTPQWLSQHFAEEEIIIGRHYLIVFEYNYERLINRINKYLQLCSGETWKDVAEKVGRLGLWEFEDYES